MSPPPGEALAADPTAAPLRVVAIIPIGGLEGAKSRLGGTLDAEERRDLVDDLFHRTVRAALHSPGIAETLVISPDTGPLHIARALDKPLIGLYGYTNPKRYGPYGKYQDLLVDGYARTPGENYPISMEYRRDGMSRVTVNAVLDKVQLATTKYLAGV